jgi:hypothetical protein
LNFNTTTAAEPTRPDHGHHGNHRDHWRDQGNTGTAATTGRDTRNDKDAASQTRTTANPQGPQSTHILLPTPPGTLKPRLFSQKIENPKPSMRFSRRVTPSKQGRRTERGATPGTTPRTMTETTRDNGGQRCAQESGRSRLRSGTTRDNTDLKRERPISWAQRCPSLSLVVSVIVLGVVPGVAPRSVRRPCLLGVTRRENLIEGFGFSIFWLNRRGFRVPGGVGRSMWVDCGPCGLAVVLVWLAASLSFLVSLPVVAAVPVFP